MLGVAAGAAAAPAAAAAGALTTLERDGRAVVVVCGGLRWRVDPTVFGPQAVAQADNEAGGISISLRDARLAGCNLRLDFDARVFVRGGRPIVELQSLGSNASGAVDLGGWLSGDADIEGAAPRRLNVGGIAARIEDGTLALRADLSLRITAASIDLGGANKFRGQALALAPVGPDPTSYRHLSTATGKLRATHFTLEGGEADRAVRTAGAAARAWSFQQDRLTAIEGEAFDGPAGAARVLLVDGSGAFCGADQSDGGNRGVRLERASLVMPERCGADMPAVIAGRVSRASHSIDFGAGVATVAGDDDAPFFARLHRTRVSDVAATVRLEKLWLPLAGARAEVAATGQLLDVVFRRGPKKKAPKRAAKKPSPSGAGILLLTGRNPMLITASDDLKVRVRRSEDLLDLTFQFTGFDLRVAQGEAYLRRRGAPSKWVDGFVRVDLPPQHISEDIFDVQEPKTCSVKFPTPVRTRLSSPSRIVFSDKVVPGKKPKWTNVPLTVEALTDWSKLSIEVHARALPGDAGLLDQLAVPKITKSDSERAAMKKIAGTLTAPGPGQTSLELSGRLLFSPSKRARFIASPSPKLHTRTPLFHIRLDDLSPADLRAIWSRRFKEGRFWDGSDLPQDLLPLKAKEHWEIILQNSIYGLPALRRLRDPNSTDPVDQEFAKSPNGSVVRPDGDWTYIATTEQKEGEGGVFMPGPFQEAGVVLSSWGASLEAEWRGDPPILVNEGDDLEDAYGQPMKWPYVPSMQRLAYRSQLARDIRVESFFKGYLLPLGLPASFVRLRERRFFFHEDLKSVFAYVVQRTFVVSTPKPKAYPAVSQPYMARDFPASSVAMQTLRTPDLVDPETSKAPKDATEPTVDKTGRVHFPGAVGAGLVFWPRTNADHLPGEGDGDVEFKWSVDGDPAPVKSNLLFVDQTSMIDKAVMGPLIEYYKGLKTSLAPARAVQPRGRPATADDAATPPKRASSPASVAPQDPPPTIEPPVPAVLESVPSRLRIARLDGARRTYADPRQEGDTSFDTHRWVLSARGRVREATDERSTDIEFYDVDGRMNGADQPPFYPWVEQADIDIQSLDRLLGPQGPVTVSYLDEHRKRGWSKASEIYLGVVKPAIPLDVGNRGDSIGGVARPNTYVAALSRVSGIVGGTVSRAKHQTGSPSAALAALPASRALAGDDYVANFKAARDGMFQPDQMFEGGSGVILGFIDLKQVIPAAQTYAKDKVASLFETVGYGPLGEAPKQALDTIKAIVAAAADENKPARKVLKELKTLLETPIKVDKFDKKAAPTGAELYPLLYRRVIELDTKLVETAAAVKKATNLTGVATPTAELLAVTKALISEIDRIRHDPLPPLLHEELDKFAANWAVLRGLATGQVKAIGSKAGALVRDAIESICVRLEKAGMGPSFWGLSKDITCKDIVEDPSVLLALADPLFETALARPLANMLSIAQDLEMLATARVATPRALLQSKLEEALTGAAEILRPLLHPPTDENQDHVLNPKFRRKLAAVTVDAVQAALAKLITDGGAQQVLNKLKTAYATVKTALPALDSEIDKYKAAFPALDNDVEGARKAFKKTVDPAAALILQQVFEKPLQDAVARAADLLTAKREEVLRDLLLSLTPIVDGLSSLSAFARVSELGYEANQWCHDVGAKHVAPMLAFADDAMGGLMGSAQAIVAQVAAIEEAVDDLSPPSDLPADLLEQYENARLRIKSADNKISDALLKLLQTREDLAKWRTDLEASGACPLLAPVLDAVRGMVDHRCDALSALRAVAAAAADIEAILARAEARLGRAKVLKVASDPLKDLAKAGARLTALITSIDKAKPNGSDWAPVKKLLADLKTALSGATKFVEAVQQAEDRWLQRAGDMRDAVAKVDTPAALRALAVTAQAYVREAEREGLGAALECVALPADIASDVAAHGLTLLKAAAALFDAVYLAAEPAVNAVSGLIHSDIIELVLKGQTQQFDDGHTQFVSDRKAFADIQAAGDLDTALTDVGKLLTAWESPGVGVSLVVASLVQLVGDVLRGKLTDLVPFDKVFERIEAAFKELLERLVPTRVDLRYDWHTAINGIDSVFGMVDPSSDSSLVLEAAVSVDLITGKRASQVTGTLNPFWIQLFGTAHVATIYFKKATFTSVDGEAPSLDIKVDNVVMGELMTYIKPLEAWLAPKGAGFYIKPSTDPIGLEVGYIFDAGIVQLATITFINVSFGVAARLPFGPAKAEFDFFVGRPEAPVLISCPPYGGGGYVKFTTWLEKAKSFELAFGMGAVAAINFGPLRGQGRIMAFVFVSYEEAGWTLGAIFEAVGEGNIACFGISVYIRVQLIHSPNGAVKGSARYSFSFSVGFAKVSYSFTANYTLSEGNGGKRVSAKLIGDEFPEWDSAADHGAGAKKITNALPRKSTKWTEYRRRFAMDLLDTVEA